MQKGVFLFYTASALNWQHLFKPGKYKEVILSILAYLVQKGGIRLYARKVIEQKLDYIHNNPLQEKWNLAKRPEEYTYSSAEYYEIGIDKRNILTHYLDDY